MIRGWLARRNYENILIYKKLNAKKYFTDEEAKETLKGIFNPDPLTVYKKYEYKSKAVYTGEWKGGFRHGKGVMRWPDGATFDGEWRFGLA